MTPARCPRGSHMEYADLSLLCLQIWPPPQSLHIDFILLCSQTSPPVQSLHRDLLLLCSQIWPRPQSLQCDLLLLCSQIWLPPQSLHCDFLLLCSQTSLPPQSLHFDLCLPCSHLVCCFDFSKHFTQHFVNWPFLLFLKHSNTKKCFHFVHCFFSIFISNQAHEKYNWSLTLYVVFFI